MGYVLGVFVSTPFLWAWVNNKPTTTDLRLLIPVMLLVWFIAWILGPKRAGKPDIVRQMFVTWSICTGLSIIAPPIVDYFRMGGM